MRLKLLALVAVLSMSAICLPSSLIAQAAQEGSEPFGNLVSPVPFEAVGPTAIAAPTVNYFLSPSLTDRDESLVSGIGFGLSWKPLQGKTQEYPMQLSSSYRNIGLEKTNTSLDQFGLGFKVGLRKWVAAPQDEGESTAGRVKKEGNFALAADASDTRERSRRYKGILAADQAITARFKVTGNLVWARNQPREGDSVSDVFGGIGVEWRHNDRIKFAADYVQKNDLDLEDTFSVKATQSVSSFGLDGLPDSYLSYSVSKHGTIGVSYLVLF